MVLVSTIYFNLDFLCWCLFTLKILINVLFDVLAIFKLNFLKTPWYDTVFTQMQDNSNLRRPPSKTYLSRENEFIHM